MSSTSTDGVHVKRSAILRRMRDLRTGTKLLAGFLLMVVLLVAVGSVGIIRLAQTQERLDAMYRTSTLGMDLMGAVETDFEATRFRMVDLAIAPDEAAEQQIHGRIDELGGLITESLDAFSGLREDAQRAADLEALRSTLREYQTVTEEVVALARADELDLSSRSVRRR